MADKAVWSFKTL